MKAPFLLFTFFLFLLISTQGVAQNSYTWNGSSGTNFATAANWTPSGVPGSGDNITIVTGSNTCQLDGNRTVNNLTMTSGTLDLEGYSVQVNGTADLNAGEIQDGTFAMTQGNVDMDGTTMNCVVDIDADIDGINNTAFLKVASLISSGAFNAAGNHFSDTVSITVSATGYTNFGLNSPDTFLAPVTFDLEAAGTFRIVFNAVGSLFNDGIVLVNHSGTTGSGFMFGASGSPSATINGNVEMNVTSGSGFINFSQGSFVHNGQLTIGSEGYNSGTLSLTAYEQGSATTVDLSAMAGTSSLTLGPSLTLEGDLLAPTTRNTTIGAGCHFKGEVTVPKLTAWSGSTFDKVTDLYFANALNTGGNHFSDTMNLTVASTGYVNMGYNSPDTFLAPVTLNLEAAGTFRVLFNAVGSLFDDGIVLNNHSGTTGSGFMFGASGSPSATINGNVEINVDSTSGFIDFNMGSITHNGLLTIGSEGYHSGLLTLKAYEQTTAGVIDLSGADHNASLSVQTGADLTADLIYHGEGSATLNGATFRGDVDIQGTSLPITDCTFLQTATLKKTGTVNNLNKGNMFHGNAIIENASSGNYLYFGYQVPDTFQTDVTLINRSSLAVWLNFNTVCALGGDLTLDGDSASVINIGSYTSGVLTVFNGSTDQHLSILEPNLDVQVYRAEIDKSGGRLKLNDDITVSHELTLTDGIIECTNNAVITLNDGVEPTASDSSYVEGAVKKIGNDAFDFPVGSNGHYRPISISAPSNSTYAFTAQYFNDNVHSVYDTSSAEATISQISTNDYWTLTRDAGTTNVEVTLSWDDMTCEIGDLGELLVAAWDSSSTEWVDYGNGGTTGDSISGTIVSDGTVSDFIAFALATDNSFECVPCQAYAGEDTTLLLLQRYTLGGDSVPGNLYTWTPNQYLSYDSVFNPVLQFPDSLTQSGIHIYQVEVENSQGCVATDEVEIELEADFPIALNPLDLNSFNADFYLICDSIERILDSDEEVDTAEDGFAARFRRWSDFWSKRLPVRAGGSSGKLGISNALYYDELLQGENVCTTNTSVTQAWEPLGPMEMPTANHGLIPAMWVDPDDNNTIFVGSRGSGLFKTENALATTEPIEWTCITEPKKLASVGYRSIAVGDYYGNSNANIVASCYSDIKGWTNQYNLGLVVSVDGGQTWDFSILESLEMPEPSGFSNIEEVGHLPENYQKFVKVIKHPVDDGVFYAITRWRLYRSDDYGLSFDVIAFNTNPDVTTWNDAYYFSDIEVDSRTDAANKDNIYLCGIKPTANLSADFGTDGVPIIYKLTVSGQSTIDESSLVNLGDNLDHPDQVNSIKIDHTYNEATEVTNLSVMYLRDDYWCQNGITARTIYFESSDDEGASFQELDHFVTQNSGCSWPGPAYTLEVFEISDDLTRIYAETQGRVLGRLMLDSNGDYLPENCNWLYFNTPANPNVHADIRCLHIDFSGNGDDDRIFVGHDGGISFSDDSPTYTWQNLNGVGLNNSDFFNVSVFEDLPYQSYYGAQDNGFMEIDESKAYARLSEFGDGYQWEINQEDANIVATHTGGGEVSSYSPVECGSQTHQLHGPRISVDNENNLYLGYQEITRRDFDNLSGGCANIGSIPGDGQMGAFHITSDVDKVYASMVGPSWNSPPAGQFFYCSNATDANPTWVDRSFGQLAWSNVWDVTSSESDPGKVWVSFSGIAEDGSWRVARSSDAGATWEDYSFGLPAFPVSRLVYQKGSNDLLYAATDVGVYYRDATMTDELGGWQCFSNDLPICVVSDIEIDYCERKLYASTFGRGAWLVDLIEDNTSTELEITSNETWDETKRIWQTLITVKSGYTLTIDGSGVSGGIEIKLPKGCKIVVEEGARLVVEDATLTNACGNMWQGIEVWGDPSEEPDMSTSSPQGILQLNTNAVIENAVLGLYLGKDNNCCNKSGGIVKANGGTGTEVIFRNNRKHVAFGPYQYESESSFLNTDFICSSALQDEEAYPNMGTQQYVSIWGQDGITFTNCNFENTLTGTADEFGPLDRGQGIRAVDAKVNVLATSHSGSTYYSEFKGLTSGIHVSHTFENGSRLHVDDVLFENTTQGVLSEGSLTDHISSSKFSIPQPENLSWTIDDWGYGVYMFDGTNHILNDNIFDSYDTQDIGLRGYISNGAQRVLGPLPVYYITGGLAWKNTFDNILVGTQTEKDNFALSLRCNTYNADNTVDWWLNPETTWGILGPQGFDCDPNVEGRAENLFNDASSGVEHIATYIQPFQYYASGGTGTLPNASEPTQNIAISDCAVQNETSCNEDPIILNPDFPDTQAALFRIAQQDSTLDVLQAEMDTLKLYLDSSMTDTLLAHIGDANYNKQSLTDELVQYSLLSDTVMNAACSRTPFFTAAQFQDIMLRNSPVSRRVWPYLKNALDSMDAKDNAYRDTIIEAQANDTVRTAGAVERDMDLAHTKRFGGIATMLNYYTGYDTVPDSTYALIHFLADSLQDKQWKRVAVGVALKADTTSWARSILDSIPKENADDSTFYDYYHLAIDLKEDTLTWFDVDSTQRALIDTIAAGISTIKYRAQAVQMLLDDTVFVRIPEQVPQSPSERRAYQELAPEELASQTALKVYPNPFQNQFNVTWELEDDAAQLQFDVFDLTGRLIHTELTQATKFGTHVLNLGECNGFYILRVSENGNHLYQEKLLCLGQ